MPRPPSLRARLALLAGASLCVAGTSAQSTCYNTWGKEDASLRPCFVLGQTETSGTTWCCNKDDSCLSNGLCLSHASNNLMTQQGCTDKDWNGSCKRYCSASNVEQTLDQIALVPCAASFNSATNDVKFCCGPDPATCCENSISWITIPPGTIIRQPAASSQTSSDRTSNDDTTESESESTDNTSLKIGLGIGLGIGVPIFLVLLAVAYLLSQPLYSRRRRHNNTNGTKDRRKPTTGATTEKTSSTSDSYPARTWHRSRDRHRRRGSFGQVDTHIRPSTDGGVDGHGDASWQHPHAWPAPVSAGGKNAAAAAVATWARSPFGFGGLFPPPQTHGLQHQGQEQGQQVPESPKEMAADAGGRSELPSGSEVSRVRVPQGGFDDGACRESGLVEGKGGSSSIKWGWKGARRVHVAAEEVELPTPDTPERDVERGLGR